MEKRLKKERRKLLRRIIIIMLAIWIVISALFCILRLSMESIKVKNDEYDEYVTLNNLTQILAKGTGSYTALTNMINKFYSMDNDLKYQLTITNQKNEKLYHDTAYTHAESFRKKNSSDVPEDYPAIINYWDIRDALSAEDLDEIRTFLTAKRDDGNYYELDCTKLQTINAMTIPLELKLVLVDGKDSTSLIDTNVKTYSLDRNKDDNYVEYNNSDFVGSTVIRNVIPKDFLFDGKYAKQLIATLSAEQRQNNSVFLQQDDNLIFYTNTSVNFLDENNEPNAWFIEYAHIKPNSFEICKKDLIIGVAALFVFFLMVGIFLYIMIWRVVKMELLLEQQRLDLTNALAHDIKTPLFVTSGYAYSLKEGIDEKERDLYLEKIIEQTDEANDLVHRMLKFSKLDSYKITLRKSEFDLRELTEAVLENYKVLSDNKRIVLTHSGDNTVNADKGLIKTALQNLTDNAVKYAFPDSEIKIDISDKAFSISNQTEPLTKDELKELQMPYMRKDKSRSQKGNGLGLSIVKSILDLHDAPFDIKMKDTTLTCSFVLKTKKK